MKNNLKAVLVALGMIALAGLTACDRPQPDIWAKISRGAGEILEGGPR